MNKSLILILVGAAIAPAGCGGTTSASSDHRPKAYLLFDGSSFKKYAGDYKPDVQAVAEGIANKKGTLLAAVVDGQPLTSARITALDFSQVPREVIDADPGSIPQMNLARADGFALKFTRTWGQAEVVFGSGQLEGLKLAADTPGVSQVYFWTDSIVNEPDDGFNVARSTDAQVTSEIKRWQPKLRGLKGVTVTAIGVGRGVYRTIEVDRAHRLFQRVIEGNGGHLHWLQSLNQAQG